VDRRWNRFLRATAVAGLAGISIVLLFPGSAPLIWLGVLGIPANSPLSPILPTAFEPLIMEAAKHASAVAVTVVASAVYLYTEYLNWHLYAWVLSWQRFQVLQDRRWVKWGVSHFTRSPFTTVVVFAFTPIPFWIARCLAILHRYPIQRFMLATLVGRLPRFFLYAWFGAAIQAPTAVLVGIIFGTALLVIGSRLARHRPVLAETVLDQG